VSPTRWLSLSIAALIGVLALPSVAVAQDSLTPEAFLDRVDRARALARLDSDAPSTDRMATMRSTLGLPVEIVIEDWSTVIPPDPILEELSGTSSTDFERAEQRLASLSRTLSDTVARTPRQSGELAAALEAAYRGVVPPRPDPLTIVLQTFDDALQAILQRLGDAVDRAGGALGWLILLGIILLAGIGLMSSGLVPDRQARTRALAGAGVHSVDWMARGEAALRAGDLHEAVRAFYVALLVALAARGVVADAPALTAGEARVAVRRVRPELFPTIAQATDTYERVVYGGDTPDAGDIQHLRDATTRVRLR